MARVCVIRCHYFRDTRVQREVGALVERGHQVHVICLRSRGEPIRQQCGSVRITRVPFGHRAGAGLVRRMSEYSAFFAVVAVASTVLHLRHRFHVVQVNSVPDALVFAAFLPRCLGARVLLDLQEPLPEFFAMRSARAQPRSIVGFIERLEQASIRFADAVVTVTEPMRQRFIERGAATEKITVVMDGSDEQIFDPARYPRGKADPSRFVLISHGTIEPQYGLDTAIHAVALLRREIPALELHIIGEGSAKSQLRDLAADLAVSDRVRFSEGFLPIDELVSELASADVGVVAMKRDPYRDLTLAGKMFDFITMGVPMVVSETRSVKRAFPRGCFETFIADDAEDMARAIRRTYRDPDLAGRRAQKARDAAAPYAWSVQRTRYQRVVDELTDGVRCVDRDADRIVVVDEVG